jgi:hypothetical protein
MKNWHPLVRENLFARKPENNSFSWQRFIKQKLDIAEEISYLGVVKCSNGKIDAEIKNRISKAHQIYYQINNTVIGKNEVQTETKMQLYKSVCVPILSYAAESWATRSKNENRITAAEMKILRSLGRARRDRCRNATVREQERLIDGIEKRKLRWYGHVVRMAEDRKPRQILEGKRGRGRPRKVWIDDIKEAAGRRGKTIQEARSTWQ